VNDLFVGGLAPGDKLAYVNYVIKGKLMESEKLAEQALNNSKEQFVNSPDLASEKTSAVLDAFSAYSQTSKQSPESDYAAVMQRAAVVH
jgi:type I restriction enzyme R subunit